MTFSETPLQIAALGAVTSIGRGPLPAAAAVRAGISGFSAHPYMVDNVGRPMCVAAMPWIDPEREVSERIAGAVVEAVQQALEPVRATKQGLRISLLINLPTSRPGIPADLGRHVVSVVGKTFPGSFERTAVATLGHAGAIVALRSAMITLQEQPDSFCLVVGADSYLDADMLEWLESTEQLHGAGQRNNAWGFVPGEGAGALLVGSEHGIARLGLSPLGAVCGIGVAQEKEIIRSPSVCLGLGLTAAVREALEAGLGPGQLVTDVYCDLNGEPYRADEYAFLVTRTREHFAAPSEFVAPADCWGDVGSASAPLLIGVACVASRKGYAKGSSALVWASSVGGERGAILLETLPPLSV